MDGSRVFYLLLEVILIRLVDLHGADIELETVSCFSSLGAFAWWRLGTEAKQGIEWQMEKDEAMKTVRILLRMERLQ